MNPLGLEIKLFQLLRGLLAKMVADVSADDFHRLPSGGGNSPNWILGHLGLVNKLGVITLGGRSNRVNELMPLYGPGSTPTEDQSTLLSKDELVEVFNQSADQFLAAAEAATPVQLAALRDNPILKEQLPTVGEMVGHMLTTHFGLHLGQLSAWRRARGFDSIIEI